MFSDLKRLEPQNQGQSMEWKHPEYRREDIIAPSLSSNSNAYNFLRLVSVISGTLPAEFHDPKCVEFIIFLNEEFEKGELKIQIRHILNLSETNFWNLLRSL